MKQKNLLYRIHEKLLLFFLKDYSQFFFIDLESTQKNYYNVFHIAPNILIAVFSLVGLIICNKKNSKLNYLILLMLVLLMVYSLFALLPRYKIYIIPFQILLTLKFVEYFLKKLSKNY